MLVWIGIAVVILVVALLLAEWALRRFRPLPDPYAADKLIVRPINSYVPRSYAPHLSAEIETSGLPGLAPVGRFTTNEQGMRSPELSRVKRPGCDRIFVVGGSAIECRHIDDALTISARLQAELAAPPRGRDVEVVFAGAWAARSFDHLAALAHVVFHLDPDLVILSGGLGDLFQAMEYGSGLAPIARRPARRRTWRQLAPQLATESQLARLGHRVVRPPRPRRDVFKVTPGDEGIVWQRGAPRRPEERGAMRLDLKTYRENLRSAVGMAIGHRVPIVLTTQPSRMMTPRPELGADPWCWLKGLAYRRAEMVEGLARYNDVTREVARELGVPLCDLAAMFDGAENCFFDDCHYTIAGADATARALAAFVDDLRAHGPARPPAMYSATQPYVRSEGWNWSEESRAANG